MVLGGGWQFIPALPGEVQIGKVDRETQSDSRDFIGQLPQLLRVPVAQGRIMLPRNAP